MSYVPKRNIVEVVRDIFGSASSIGISFTFLSVNFITFVRL